MRFKVLLSWLITDLFYSRYHINTSFDIKSLFSEADSNKANAFKTFSLSANNKRSCWTDLADKLLGRNL